MNSLKEFVTGNLAMNMEHALLNLKGQRWKEVRATLTPSFTTKKLKQVCGQILICSALLRKIAEFDILSS